jgi:hypothetical protein
MNFNPSAESNTRYAEDWTCFNDKSEFEGVSLDSEENKAHELENQKDFKLNNFIF